MLLRFRVVMAKGLIGEVGGLPLSLLAGDRHAYRRWEPGCPSSTFDKETVDLKGAVGQFWAFTAELISVIVRGVDLDLPLWGIGLPQWDWNVRMTISFFFREHVHVYSIMGASSRGHSHCSMLNKNEK